MAVCAVLLLSSTAPGAAQPTSDTEEAAVARFSERLRERIADGSLAATDPPSPNRAVPRISVFGDSTALFMASGLLYHLEREGQATAGITVAEPGCGILRRGTYRWRDQELQRPAHCVKRESAWGRAIAVSRPDIAVVAAGPWEVCDRRLRLGDHWRHLGDPVIDEEMRRELLAGVDLLAKDGTLVIWLTSPEIGNASAQRYPESDPARMARFNELVFELEKLRPGAVRVADLGAHARSFPKGVLDPDFRPDGVHLSLVGALRLAREWLAAELLRLYREDAAHAPGAAATRGAPGSG
jgi:hypothetical protein